MRTIGQLIKEARVRKKLSREKLEEKTKIKKGFIQALEQESWDELPEYPVLQGFVSSIAKILNISTYKAIAILRRDYPPKRIEVNPKPDISERFSWNPKLTFFAASLLVVLFVSAYLIFQYARFTGSPKLNVISPTEGQVIEQNTLLVIGKTDSDAIVKVNNQSVLTDDDGNFQEEIRIYEGTFEVEVTAKSRSGKETIIRRKIIPKLE